MDTRNYDLAARTADPTYIRRTGGRRRTVSIMCQKKMQQQQQTQQGRKQKQCHPLLGTSFLWIVAISSVFFLLLVLPKTVIAFSTATSVPSSSRPAGLRIISASTGTATTSGGGRTLTAGSSPNRIFRTSSVATSSAARDDIDDNHDLDMHGRDDVIPVTVLSGFLGSGKTTLLTQILQNKEGLKIGVVVNDVAAVNIDSKLLVGARDRDMLRTTTPMDNEDDDIQSDMVTSAAVQPDGMVELQNGCACCSLSDELLTSVSRLVTMSDVRNKEDQFHHIVIELSGVADPKQVRAKFQEATLSGMPLMDRVRLDTLVTVVDCSMFESYFGSDKTASRKETPELFETNGGGGDSLLLNEEDEEEEWMKDMPPQLLEAVLAGLRGESTFDEDHNGVADLLVSQVETADVVVLNKCDLMMATADGSNNDNNNINNSRDVARLVEIVSALNPRATLQQTTYGNVPLTSILAVAKGLGVAVSGTVDDHRDYVAAAMRGSSTSSTITKDAQIVPDDVAHSHSHGDATETINGEAVLDSNDHSHTQEDAHSHSHSHSHAADDDCVDDHDCTDDDSHSHSHAHSHSRNEVEMNDATAGAVTADSCSDPTCNDPNHSHVHSHAHSTDQVDHAGIGTFVYRARRPFHPGRLVAFLRQLPVVRGIPEVASDDEYEHHQQHLLRTMPPDAGSTLKATLRSKGFLWCADSHSNAMYWSQAGASFELTCLGQWWATLPRTQWPPGIDEYVLQDFDDPDHIDEDNTETNPTSSVGDRRQEIVFIGPQFDSTHRQRHIQETLDQCLLTTDEYHEYRLMQTNEEQLQSRFANAMESRYVNL